MILGIVLILLSFVLVGYPSQCTDLGGSGAVAQCR